MISVLVSTATASVVSVSTESTDSNLISEAAEVDGLKHGFGVGINFDVGGEAIHNRDLGDIVVATLALFLLESKRDTTHGTLLDAAHQVGHVSSDLVAEALGGNDGHLVTNAFVGLEVEGELGKVLLDDETSGSLGSLSTYATL